MTKRINWKIFIAFHQWRILSPMTRCDTFSINHFQFEVSEECHHWFLPKYFHAIEGVCSSYNWEHFKDFLNLLRSRSTTIYDSTRHFHKIESEVSKSTSFLILIFHRVIKNVFRDNFKRRARKKLNWFSLLSLTKWLIWYSSLTTSIIHACRAPSTIR